MAKSQYPMARGPLKPPPAPPPLSIEDLERLRVQWETEQRCLAEDISRFPEAEQAVLRKLKTADGHYLWNPIDGYLLAAKPIAEPRVSGGTIEHATSAGVLSVEQFAGGAHLSMYFPGKQSSPWRYLAGFFWPLAMTVGLSLLVRAMA